MPAAGVVEARRGSASIAAHPQGSNNATPERGHPRIAAPMPIRGPFGTPIQDSGHPERLHLLLACPEPLETRSNFDASENVSGHPSLSGAPLLPPSASRAGLGCPRSCLTWNLGVPDLGQGTQLGSSSCSRSAWSSSRSAAACSNSRLRACSNMRSSSLVISLPRSSGSSRIARARP